MTDNVTQLPKREPLDPLVGPFEYHKVVVEGRAIPGLSGYRDGDLTALVLDNRLSISVPPELAHQVAWFAANALAIGAGYSHLGAESKDRPFAPQCIELGEVPK